METIEAISTLRLIQKRLDQLEARIEAKHVSPMEGIIELMNSFEVVAGLHRQLDYNLGCYDINDRIGQLMERLELLRLAEVRG